MLIESIPYEKTQMNTEREEITRLKIHACPNGRNR